MSHLDIVGNVIVLGILRYLMLLSDAVHPGRHTMQNLIVRLLENLQSGVRNLIGKDHTSRDHCYQACHHDGQQLGANLCYEGHTEHNQEDKGSRGQVLGDNQQQGTDNTSQSHLGTQRGHTLVITHRGKDESHIGDKRYLGELTWLERQSPQP